MPGKSKHKRGKRYQPHSKKGKSRRHFEAPVAQPSTVTEVAEHVPQPSISAPPVSTSRPSVKPVAVRHPFIATELRTIGIMAGLIVAILTVLFFVLR